MSTTKQPSILEQFDLSVQTHMPVKQIVDALELWEEEDPGVEKLLAGSTDDLLSRFGDWVSTPRNRSYMDALITEAKERGMFVSDPESDAPPSTPKFKVDDMVELVNVSGVGGGFGSAMGQVVDPEGVDVEIFFSTHSAFKVGAMAQGISEGDLRLATLEQVQRFEEVCEMYEAATAPVVDDAEEPDMAQLMAADIKEALGDELSLERCEAVIKMTAAARDYLTARPARGPGISFEHYRESDPAENLIRLAKIIGIGANDPDDDVP